MVHAWRIWRRCVQLTLIREMQFRLNFMMWGLAMFSEVAILLLLYGSIFSATESVAGWTRWQWSFYVGLGQFLLTIFMVFFFPNLVSLPWKINGGELDFILLKPVDSQFYLSTARANPGYLVNLPLAGALIAYGATGSGTLDWQGVLPGLAWCLSGLSLLYAMFMAAVTVSIWSKRADFASELFFGLWGFMRQPPEVFGHRAGFVFTWLLPILPVVAAPAGLFLGRSSLAGSFPALALACFWFCGARIMWQKALTKYSGAGSG